MQLAEQAIERGLVGPTKRLLALAAVLYFSAALHPILPSVLSLIEGPRRVAENQTWHRGDFEFIRWQVFPPFEGFGSSMVMIYAPVIFFCVLCSAMDRLDAWRINALAGVTTFFLYVFDDTYFEIGSLMKTSCLFIVVVASALVIYGVGRRRMMPVSQ